MSFVRVTSNAAVDAAGDLTVEVIDLGASSVFLLTNTQIPGSFINQFYVEDGSGAISTMSFSAAFSSGTVDYGSGASPASPPGLSPFTPAFALDANPSKSANGVSPGEVGAFDAVHVINHDFLREGLKDGSVRVALHVQGLDGSSDTFVNLPLEDIGIPEPGSMALAAAGGACCFVLRRRRPPRMGPQ